PLAAVGNATPWPSRGARAATSEPSRVPRRPPARQRPVPAQSSLRSTKAKDSGRATGSDRRQRGGPCTQRSRELETRIQEAYENRRGRLDPTVLPGGEEAGSAAGLAASSVLDSAHPCGAPRDPGPRSATPPGPGRAGPGPDRHPDPGPAAGTAPLPDAGAS